MKKIKLPSEGAYFVALILLSLAVAILTQANFGVSMIVAPAYLLSLKLGVITFGQAEYIVQGILFIILCVVLKKFKLVYFVSFITCLIYGFVLDLWRKLPCFDSSVTPPESIPFWGRILMFIIGMILTSFSIALFFKTYLYPQVYDFFVKAVTVKYNANLSLFKTCFDVTMLIISVIMSLCFFKGFTGIGVGTIVLAVFNGTLIGFFSKQLDRYFVFKPIFRPFSKRFDLKV